MKFGSMIAAASVALLSQSAMAQTAPKIAGPYLINYNVTCQMLTGGTGTPNIQIYNAGTITRNAGIAGFNASAGTVTIHGYSDSGSLWFDKSAGVGTAMAQSKWYKALTYVVTPTTLTLTSAYGSQTYNLIYTPTMSGRAITTFVFSAVLNANPNCSANGTAVLQTPQ